MTPQISDILNADTQTYREPNKTYRLGVSEINGTTSTALESIKQAITCILSTERYSNPIYDDDYGVELEQYMNQELGVIKAGIETTLNDALTQDDRITSVRVNSVELSDERVDACTVEFTVYTIYGDTIEEEIDVLQ